ncbi:MAG: hypothetical protein AAF532_16530 [Planctomycetota bacterium]
MSFEKIARLFISGGYVISGCVALAAILDLATGILFGRLIVMDILLLIASGIVGYLAFDAQSDLR